MKNIEEMLGEYFGCDPAYYSKQEVEEITRALEIGHDYGQSKWVKVENQLPNENTSVLCKITNEDVPEIFGYEVCKYSQEIWHGEFDGGDKVVEWMEIPK